MLNSTFSNTTRVLVALLLLLQFTGQRLQSQSTCETDTSFTDVVFLIDNSQSIDDLEFDAFEDIILRSIQKVQAKCQRSQIGVVHYGGSFGRETFIEYDLSTENNFTAVDRQFCLQRNAQGFCSSGGGDDLNHAVGEIIDNFQDGSLNRNPINKLQLVVFTDAFGFDANCGFINCSVIRPFTNVDLIKTQFGAQVTVVGASTQAEASLLAIYASPGGTFDNTDLFRDCAGTVDGCSLPRKYIPIEFDSPVEATSDNVLNCVGCEISISQAINPELGANRTICGDLGESALLTATVPDASGNLTYEWSNDLPNQATVMVRPTVNTNYKVTVTDEIGCTGVDSVTVFVESCAPDCSPDTSFTDVLFLVDNSQSIDDQEFANFEDLILASIQKVQDKCTRSQLGLIHYGGAFGAETSIEYSLNANNVFQDIERQFCTSRNSQGFCSEGGGDDLNNAIGDIIAAIENGQLNRNPINKLQLVIFTDAFGFDSSCSFINCSVIRPFTNIDRLKTEFGAQVTVVGASSQAEASLLAIYASPGGSFDNTDLFRDCSQTVDGCSLPRKYIPVEFNSPVASTSDSILACVQCEVNIFEQVNATIGPDQTICSDIDDDSATLTAVLEDGIAPFTYVWDGQFPQEQSITVRPSQTQMYRVTITDSNGCEDSASITVTVEDCIPDCVDRPIFDSCPVVYITCPGQSIDPEFAGRPVAIAANEGCPMPVLTSSDRVTSLIGCNQLITRTWTATYPGFDDINLTATCEQQIQIIDRDAPVLSNLPADFTINSDATCSAVVTWEEPIATDNCGLRSVTSSITNGSRLEAGVTTIVYTAIDQCGNIAMGMFTVTVVAQCCTEAPVITCPDDYNGCPNSSIDPSVTGMPTGMGGMDCPDLTYTFSDSRTVDADGCTVRIARTWTATYPGLDDPALVDQCIQQITLTDDTNPTISDIPQDITIDSDQSCTAQVRWSAPSADDDCEIASLTSDIPSGSVFDEGTTVVTYTAVDGCGNSVTATFNVTVIERCCTDPPIITCPSDFMACPGSNIDPSVTGIATGVAGGPDCPNPTISFSDEEVVGQDDCLVTIIRTWTAAYPGQTDISLTASCVQEIVLTDTENPVFVSVPDDITVDSDETCTAVVAWGAVRIDDNCENVRVSSDIARGSVFEVGTTVVTFTAVDACGNTASATLNVTVIERCCTDPPIITCPSDFIGCPGSNTDPSISGIASGMPGGPDCPNPTISFSDEQIMGDDGCTTTILRTWTAAYPGQVDVNLTSSCVQEIVLTDTEDPTFVSVPDDITVDSDETCTAVVAWGAVRIDDNCDNVRVSSDIQRGSIFEVGTTVVTFTAVDGCGNTATATLNVTVIERCCTTPPILTCPAAYSGCPGSNIDPSVTGIASAMPGSIDCPMPTVSFSDVMIPSDDGCTVTIERTWRALYPGEANFDLTSECVQSIVLTDNDAPVISNLPDNIVIDSDENCLARVTWPQINASDNCEIASIVTDIPSGTLFDLGVTTVTTTVTDGCGNFSVETFTVTVNKMCCTDAPIITCPTSFMGCPNSDLSPDITGTATAIPGGPECPMPMVRYDDVLTSEEGCRRTIQRTWTAFYPGRRNEQDVTSSCVQMITLDDTSDPIISNLPFNVTQPSNDMCNAIITWEEPTADDNCELVSLTADIPSGSSFEIGETLITYTAVDMCGNSSTASFTVTITQACCLDAPILLCPANYAGCPGDEITTDITGEATGFGGGNFCGMPIITSSDAIISEGPCVGQIEIARTWTATDPVNADLVTTCVQTIILIDTIPPQLIGCPEDVTLDPDAPMHTWEEPIGIDECEVEVSSSISNGSVFPTGITTVVITAIDGCGNETTCSFDVTVPPEVEITCPEDIEVRCLDTLILADLPAPMLSTDCIECNSDNIPGFEFLGSREGVSYYLSDKRRNWWKAVTMAEAAGGQLAVISDEAENDFLQSITTVNAAYIGLSDKQEEGNFMWIDGTPLTYTNWFKDQPNDFGNKQDHVEFLSNGQWNDQRNSKSLQFIMEVECVTVTRELLSTDVQGSTTIYTVQYSAVDRCGTDDECIFTVTSDNRPIIECPEDIVINVPYGWSKVSWDTPTYTSCCSECVPKQIKGYIYMGNLGDSYYYCSAGKASWKAAERRARYIGGTLAVVESAEENQFISSRLIQRTAYVGLSDAIKEGDFRWIDGSSPAYASWRDGAPSGDGDFVEVDEFGDWYDGSGAVKREFVVEVKGCNNVEQIAGPTSGSTFRTGTTTVTYMAEDGCGGQAECSFTVTITDGTSASSRSIEIDSEVSLLRSIEVYPNPVSNRLFLKMGGELDLIDDISIYQADGRRVGVYDKNAVVQSGIDVSEYISGVHLVNITYSDGEVKSKSFIVQ